MGNPRTQDGTARRKLRAWLRGQARPCWICRAFGRDGTIDYDLPPGHPYAFECDELAPVSRWREYGFPSAAACALDRANVDAAHRCCNQWRGNRSVDEVLAIARGGRVAPPQVHSTSIECSRDW